MNMNNLTFAIKNVYSSMEAISEVLGTNDNVVFEDLTKQFNAVLKKRNEEYSEREWQLFAHQYLMESPELQAVVYTSRPGKANKVKNKHSFVAVDKFPGVKKFTKKYVLFDIEKQLIVKVTDAKTVSEAKKHLKEAFANGYKGTLDVVVMKLTEHPIVARAVNNVAKSAKMGNYHVVVKK